jgi:hypothetical protein
LRKAGRRTACHASEGGILRLLLAPCPGKTNQIEVSIDLTGWAPLTNVMGGATVVEIWDDASARQRFYRAVVRE